MTAPERMRALLRETPGATRLIDDLNRASVPISRVFVDVYQRLSLAAEPPGVAAVCRGSTARLAATPPEPVAVAAPEPALEPEAPSFVSQGFMVWPPNQMSLSARAPRDSLATRTAPASFNRRTTAESAAGTRVRNGSAP